MSGKWEEKLRDKMSGYSEPEPFGLWDDIMRQVDLQVKPVTTGSGIKQAGRKHILPKMLIPVAAAAIAIAVIFRIGKEDVSDSSHAILAESGDINIIEPEKETSEAEMETTVAKEGIVNMDAGKETISMSSIDNKVIINDVAIREAATDETESLFGNTENLIAMDNSAPAIMPATPEPGKGMPSADTPAKHRHVSEISGKVPEEQEKTSPEEPDEDGWEEFFPEETERKRAERRFSTDVFISNLTGSRESIDGYGTHQPATTSFRGIPIKKAMSYAPEAGLMLLTKEQDSSTEIRHRQPVRAGVSFRYSFTRRWAMETGLVYSFLASQMTSGNNSYSSKTEQELHYIGIPLKASFTFLSRRYLTIYANAGGMVEKCISGKAVTNYSVKEMDTAEDKLNIKPLQWSVSAAAGLQCNFTPMLGLYVEPGVSYHFDDGSMVSTIYKEKPLNFNIEFGLRFSFE